MSCKDRLVQLRPVYVMLDQVRSDYDSLGHVKSGLFKLRLIRSG